MSEVEGPGLEIRGAGRDGALKFASVWAAADGGKDMAEGAPYQSKRSRWIVSR